MTAQSGGISATVTVTVAAPPTTQVVVDRVVASRDTLTLTYLGQVVQVTAQARNADGQAMDTVKIGYQSTKTGVATVDTQGRITARGAGTALVVATALCCGKADTVRVTVDQALSSVTVSPGTLSLQVGGTATLAATVKDAGGSAVTGASMSWSTGSGGIASVSGTGSSATVSAVAAGSTNVTVVATKSGKQVTGTVPTQVTAVSSGPTTLVNECSNPGSGWIWCDDFDQSRLNSYYEYNNAGGQFVRASGVGVSGSSGMSATFQAGGTTAGDLKVAFGRTPDSYMDAVDAGTANYREIYWRMYVRNAPGWVGGGGYKLSRATVFARSDWSQAAMGHVWSVDQDQTKLAIDPASGTDASGNLKTSGYNDFPNLRWLGEKPGVTPIFDASHVGEWYCVEARMRLNDPGQSNGTMQLWIDGKLEAEKAGMNWVGSFTDYGINTVMFENYLEQRGARDADAVLRQHRGEHEPDRMWGRLGAAAAAAAGYVDADAAEEQWRRAVGQRGHGAVEPAAGACGE